MFNEKSEEMVLLADDAAKRPLGSDFVRQGAAPGTGVNGERVTGAASQVNLDHAKVTAVIRYKDLALEADVYALPGEAVKVVILCPRCGNANNIDATRKAIDWRPRVPERVGVFMNHGELSIEPFECAWELPDAGEHKARSGDGLQVIGLASMCRLKIGVIRNVAKDA